MAPSQFELITRQILIAVSTRLFSTQTLLAHNFVDHGWFLTKPVPIERSLPGLSIGTDFVKNQPL